MLPVFLNLLCKFYLMRASLRASAREQGNVVQIRIDGLELLDERKRFRHAEILHRVVLSVEVGDVHDIEIHKDHMSANLIRTEKRFGHLYLCGDGKSDVADGLGLMAPRVAVCSAHEGTMVLRLLIGETEP